MNEPRLFHCPHRTGEWIGKSARFPLAPHVVPEDRAKPGDIIGMAIEITAAEPFLGRPMLTILDEERELTRVMPFHVDAPGLMQAALGLYTDPALTKLVRELVARFREDSEDRWRLEISPESVLLIRSEMKQIARLLDEEAELQDLSIDDVPVDAGLIEQVACLVVPSDRSAHRRMEDTPVLTAQVRRLERRLSAIFDEKVLLNAHPVLSA